MEVYIREKLAKRLKTQSGTLTSTTANWTSSMTNRAHLNAVFIGQGGEMLSGGCERCAFLRRGPAYDANWGGCAAGGDNADG
jgi:hypothetical protein